MKAQHEQERRKSKNPLYPKRQNSSDVTIKRKSEKTQGKKKKKKPHPKPQNSSEKKKGKYKQTLITCLKNSHLAIVGRLSIAQGVKV
jgi:hypothetical protein